MAKENPYDRRYSQDKLYWGTKPSDLCDRLLEFCAPDDDHPYTLIDLGAGEGRNAVYLAQAGFSVTALDHSAAGVDKAKRVAKEAGVRIDTIVANIENCRLPEMYDVTFSTGTFHYLPQALRADRIGYFKARTTDGGIHAISVLVQKPFIKAAPDAEPGVVLFKSGELLSYYWDWEILHSYEGIFDCMSSGIPHRHAVNRIVARRV